MSRRGLCILATLFLASAARAAWMPFFQPGYVVLRPGEATVVDASAGWASGLWYFPFSTPWMFTSKDPSVATVQGHVLTSSQTWPIRIDAHRVGVTHVLIIDPPIMGVDREYMLIVVAERYEPVSIGVNGVFAPGRTITLSAVTDSPDATFTWYQGRLGQTTWGSVGTGRDLTFVPQFTTRYEYWVSMVSPTGAGASAIAVEVTDPRPRRRATRHSQ